MMPALPVWITTLPEDKRLNHSLVFYLKLAALYATPEGTLPALSTRIGRNDKFLSEVCNPNRSKLPRGFVSAEDALAIESVVTRDVMPREALRPDIFALPKFGLTAKR